MAYAAKYSIPFYDNENNACEVLIYKNGYVGSVIELTPAFSPCKLNYNGNVNNKVQNIITSELNFAFVRTNNNDDFSELYSNEETTFRVELYKDFGLGQVLQWKGILIPDSYQEVLQYFPTEIRLTAVCGLSRLKFYNYQIEDFDSGVTFISKNEGVKYVTQYLSEIFSKADMGVLDMTQYKAFFEFVGFSANPLNDFANNSFEHRYLFDSSLAYDDNGKAITYYQLLEEICKFQQARCFQYNGVYHIISVPLYTNTYYGVAQSFETRVDLDTGTTISPTCTSNYLNEFYTQLLYLNTNDITDGSYISTEQINIEKSYKQDFIYALSDQLISYQPGIRNAQITSKIDRGAAFINNSSFDSWLSTDSAPKSWVDATGGNLQRIEYNNDIFNTNYVNQGSLISVGVSATLFGTTAPTPGVTPYDFIYSIPSIVPSNSKFKFRFWLNYNEPIDTGVVINIPFVIKAGNYYARPQSGGTSWTTTPYLWEVDISLLNYTTLEWLESAAPSITSTTFFTNLNLSGSDKVAGLEIGFYMPYLTGGTLTTPGTLKIDDVQIITPESQGIYNTNRDRYEQANEYGLFAFNNDNITGKIKYSDFDYLSSTTIDKDNNNDITLMLSAFKPSNIRRYFYAGGGAKSYIFPNQYPAGSLVVSDGTTIYQYDGNFARFSNQGEFTGLDGYAFYVLYMLDLFRLYEKTMQLFSGTLYPYTASSEYSIINIFKDNITNGGVILLPSKVEIDYKTNFTKIEAFEIQGNDKVLGSIEIPTGNYIAPNDPDVGEEV